MNVLKIIFCFLIKINYLKFFTSFFISIYCTEWSVLWLSFHFNIHQNSPLSNFLGNVANLILWPDCIFGWDLLPFWCFFHPFSQSAGLSSSSALVCCAGLATMHAHDKQLSKVWQKTLAYKLLRITFQNFATKIITLLNSSR